MELRQLEYFAAVARRGHFTRAAEDLYVTQPALSQQIRRLEAELGLQLLRRTPRGAELTPAGEELLVHAERTLAEVARARESMDRHAGLARGVARVAATAADAPGLPEALAAFHREHPGVQIALRHASAAEVVGLAQRAVVDAGVVSLRGEAPPGLDVAVLADGPLEVLLAPDDPLAGRTVALGELRGRPFVLAEAGSALREAVMGACQAEGFSPVPLFEVSDPAAVRVLVHAGLGIALAPAAWAAAPGPAVGVAVLAPPAPRHRVSVLSAPGRSGAGRLLLERLRELGDEPGARPGADE